MTPALSFVIPLYASAETITALVKEIEGLAIEGGRKNGQAESMNPVAGI